MEFLATAHSILRWIILLAGLAALARFLIGWQRGGQFAGLENGLRNGFTGLMDLQLLLGAVILFVTGFGGAGFPAYRLEHTFYMVLAVIAAHLQARWKASPDDIRFRNSSLSILAALVLIFVGVARLPGGWQR